MQARIAAATAGRPNPPLKRPTAKRVRQRFVLDLPERSAAELDQLVAELRTTPPRAAVIRTLIRLAARDPKIRTRLARELDDNQAG
jgi:hypothetical protein